MTSYYITQIERKLKALGIDPNSESHYNSIFDELDDKRFLRKLRKFNEFLNQLVDEKNRAINYGELLSEQRR